MADNIRELIEWYPLMPVVSNADLIRNTSDLAHDIRDMRIRVVFPPGDELLASAITGDELFRRPRLMTLSEGTAKVRVFTSIPPMSATYIPASGYADMTIPVLSGQYNDGNPWESYIIMSSGAYSLSSDTAPDGLEIHPDCLEFMQAPPSLVFEDRGAVSSIDGISGVDGRVGNYVPISGSIDVINGHNTLVVMSGGVMTITGGAELGQGVYTSSPYSDSATAPISASQTVGLRSINGFTGGVQITGTPNIAVTADTTAAMTTRLTITVTVD